MDVLLRPLSGISLPSPRSAGFSSPSHAFDPVAQRPRNKIPSALKSWIAGGTILVMLLLAIGIEVALLISDRNHGFAMHFRTEQVQWLSGFLPTLAIGPIVWIWKRADKDFKMLQPYVTLSHGPAKADESVLLDLAHVNTFQLVWGAFKRGHYLVLGSSLICIVNILLHPLAGSFFLVRPTAITGPADTPVRSTATLGLNPSYKDITSFVAAAGFSEAAAFHNLSDPPFVRGNWAIAEFKVPLDVTRNATLFVRTIGVETTAACSASGTFSLTPGAQSNWTLTAALPGRGASCTVTQSIDSTAARTQYGVEPVPGCAQGGSANGPFAPVVFWFFSNGGSTGVPVGSAVFCAPTVAAFSVEAAADAATGLLVGVNVTGSLDPQGNNVTGGTFAGKAFNGISFDSGSDFNLTDPFVRARALAVQSGVPGTIFRFASDPDQSGGLDAVFGNSTGFLGLTEKIYTQYLSIVALANYFVPTEASVDADITLWPNRLWINKLTAHFLSTLLILVAVAGGAMHIVHTRQRKNLYLASRPGTMAHYMSLLADPQMVALVSNRGDLNGNTALGPRDDERTMEQKLEGIRFVLDTRTGSLVPVLPGEWSREVWRGSGQGYELDDPRKSLLSVKADRHDPFHPKGVVGGPS